MSVARVVAVIMVFWGLPLSAVTWNLPIDEDGRHQVDVDLDPYYSSVGYNLSLTDDPIPKLKIGSEFAGYWYLLKNIYLPRFVLFEGSVNPLPIAGVYIKRNRENFYNDAAYRDWNMIRAVTDGFPDPGAVSVFFGNIVNYVNDDGSDGDIDDRRITGKGYSGIVGSFGNFHIVNNTLVEDYWQEYELKLKGTDIRESHNLNWSYALGTRFHQNDEIKDTFYFFIKRTRVDYLKTDSFFLYDFFIRNSSQQIRLDFSLEETRNRNITRVYFVAGKNISFMDDDLTFGLNVGWVKTYASGYSGSLTEKVSTKWSFLVQPNVIFNF